MKLLVLSRTVLCLIVGVGICGCASQRGTALSERWYVPAQDLLTKLQYEVDMSERDGDLEDERDTLLLEIETLKEFAPGQAIDVASTRRAELVSEILRLRAERLLVRYAIIVISGKPDALLRGAEDLRGR
jgi:hypothetical protein